MSAVHDRSSVTPPPCPECGAPTEIDWLECTALGEQRRSYLPGEIECTANPDHHTRPALRELSWPPELTEADRAWLRAHTS